MKHVPVAPSGSVQIDPRYWVTAILLLVAPCALAQVSMTLTSPGAGNVMDNVYTSPYTGTVAGQTGVPIICDDFADDSYLGEAWTATISTVADLAANVKWATQDAANLQYDYDEAAWLAEQLLLPANSNPTTLGYISFALWDVLDPGDVAAYLGATDPHGDIASGAQVWENLAAQQTFYAGEFGNVLVYTPDLNFPITCGSGPCPTAPPQEFLRVTTPEAPALIIFAVDLLGLASLVAFLGRRKLRFSR